MKIENLDERQKETFQQAIIIFMDHIKPTLEKSDSKKLSFRVNGWYNDEFSVLTSYKGELAKFKFSISRLIAKMQIGGFFAWENETVKLLISEAWKTLKAEGFQKVSWKSQIEGV